MGKQYQDPCQPSDKEKDEQQEQQQHQCTNLTSPIETKNTEELENSAIPPKELVMVVPRYLTKIAYSVSLANDLVPRRWHLEGQYGSRTYAIGKDKMGFPLISSPDILQRIIYDKNMDSHQENDCDHKNNDGDNVADKKNEEILIQTNEANLDISDAKIESNPIETTKKRRLNKEKNDIVSLNQLLAAPGVQVMHLSISTEVTKIPKLQPVDATFHPEKLSTCTSFSSSFWDYLNTRNNKNLEKMQIDTNEPEERSAAFTFAELFAGIGGFGIALEALGGTCVFASEISKPCVRLYERNMETLPVKGVSGDIWTIDGKDIPSHDILVGGFPCQPFSSLGQQPGLSDNKKRPSKLDKTQTRNEGDAKNNICRDEENDCMDEKENVNDDKVGGRGQLYTQIVRVLKECQPEAFLLENVQGLLHTDNGNALKTIVSALEEVGYNVSVEVCSSRCLTAQSRKRLFLVGLSKKEHKDPTNFEFPYIPDLGLRARDILCSEEEVRHAAEQIIRAHTSPDPHDPKKHDTTNNSTIASSPTMFHLTDAQMDQLRTRSKSWKPAKLAWSEKVCDTLDSHYGNSVGKGHSQLVPSPAPTHPRRFTPRECARLMGFGHDYKLETHVAVREAATIDTNTNKNTNYTHQSPLAYIKEQYRMLGNAVCPPVIAALGGAILEKCPGIAGYNRHENWVDFGRLTACRLALEAVSPQQRTSVEKRLYLEWSATHNRVDETSLMNSL